MQRLINNYNLSVLETREAFQTENDNLMIGFTNIPIEHFTLPKILSDFSKSNPKIKISLENLGHNSLKRRLQNQENDLIFTTKDDLKDFETFKFLPLTHGGFHAWIPKDNPLAKKDELDIQDLKDHKLILMDNNWSGFEQIQIQDQLRKNNHNFNVSYTNNVQTANMVVQAGLAITVMPGILADPQNINIKLVPLRYNVDIEYGIAYKEKDKLSIKLFLDWVKTHKYFVK